ncbi:hemin ABC transporter substrate-binding protein [Reinekea thalattae]|uniref:Hemin ABC transporter substrate-binding protein n=2 Tax=Reinekea thalattae TaxID=2593301 RepID=A0A5C8Z203_9GAMM|nr:hemin ABC transporter substrate-binding protein [Reinekea thalattae]
MVTSPLFAEAPKRIVSADGSLTEIIFALGEQHRLVGVDTTSTYPQQASELPQIGYKRNLSAEGMLSLLPDVIVATQDSGPERVINQLQAAGVNIQTYSEQPSLDAVKEKILGIAELLEKPKQGQALWQQVEQQVAEAEKISSNIEKPVRVMFVLSLGDRSPLVAGRNSSPDTMIQLAGANNAVTEFEGYKPMPVEAIIKAQPDVILMMDRAGHSTNATELFALPGFSATPAAEQQRLILIDGLKLLGFGPRIGEAISELTQQLYSGS